MAKKKGASNKIRITYNAPATLTFALAAALVLLLGTILGQDVILALFSAPGGPQCPDAFNFRKALDYARLFLHVFCHAGWSHLVSNLAFILLLGPVIEERYGTPVVVLMMAVTALVTGVLNACFSPTALAGSSDIAFMMILLASFTSITRSEIPLSFILILALYVGREIIGRPAGGNISTLAHIAGGLCGSLFAFLAAPRRRASRKTSSQGTGAESADATMVFKPAELPHEMER